MLEDYSLALLELSEDMLFNKIPKTKLDYYINSAISRGETEAKKHIGVDIFQLYRDNNIEIEYQEHSGAKFGVVLRGQAIMDKSGSAVVIYKDSITALANNSSYKEYHSISYERALEIHLAHELFHFFEFSGGEFVSDSLDSIESLKILGYTRQSKILRTSEIAHIYLLKICWSFLSCLIFMIISI